MPQMPQRPTTSGLILQAHSPLPDEEILLAQKWEALNAGNKERRLSKNIYVSDFQCATYPGSITSLSFTSLLKCKGCHNGA